MHKHYLFMNKILITFSPKKRFKYTRITYASIGVFCKCGSLYIFLSTLQEIQENIIRFDVCDTLFFVASLLFWYHNIQSRLISPCMYACCNIKWAHINFQNKYWVISFTLTKQVIFKLNQVFKYITS